MQPAQFAQRLMGLASASRGSLLPSVLNSSYQASYATTAASTGKSTYNVPEGHHDSDLSSTACHIGLGRRRDLTLRQDLCLWDQGSKLSLADVFKGSKTLLVGFPGGKICTEQHLPGYAKSISELKAAGVDKVVAVTVSDPTELQQWAAQQGLDKVKEFQILADRNQSFMRLLGVELTGETGPKCQRFAGIVDDGILLRLKVEQSPAELKVADVKSMLRTFKEAYA